MSKKILVILADGFEEIEAISPIDLLTRAGMHVTVAGLTNTHVKAARSGLIIEAETTLNAVKKDFDCVVLPGGPGSQKLAKSDAVISLLKQMNKEEKLLAAICAAPALVFTKAGILDGRKVTCAPGMEHHLSKKTTFIAEPVVRDGSIITSQGAGTAFLFGLMIIEALAGKDMRKKIEESTAYHSEDTM